MPLALQAGASLVCSFSSHWLLQCQESANLHPPLFNPSSSATLFQKVSLTEYVSEGDVLAAAFIMDQVTGLSFAVVDLWESVCIPTAHRETQVE